jgi:aspartate kinase
VPDIPGKAAAIFQVIADAHSNIDMIVQNVSTHGTGRTDISFTLPIVEGADALVALKAAQPEIGFENIEYNEQIGKLSLIGAGMRSHPGITATFFAALASAGVNIEMISTSEIRISVIVDESQVNDAVASAHSAFDLDADQVEAVVYGGTGR